MANNLKKYASDSTLSALVTKIKELFATKSELAKKADSSHTHAIANVTNLQSTLDAKVPTSRTINSKPLSANITLSASDVGAAASSHNHDGRYYTETEVDTLLASKSDTTHNHDTRYDSKGSASAVQENLDTVSDTLSSHTTNADIHFTAAERTKLSGIAAGAQVNAVTGVKGGSESTYRTGNINITKANIGLGNVDNTADSAKSVKYATSAGSATSATKATQDASGNVITTTYETKSDASAKLTEAKTYADNAANTVKNDLLNNAGAAYDTLKELGDLIDDNKDAIDALETIAAGKANATHTHAISDVTNLQSTLDGKAAKSHGTHVTYSTTVPVMDGTASVGTASTVARSDHKHPTDTSRASKTEFDNHISDTVKHITSTERTKWNTASTTAASAKTRADNAYTLAESKVDSLSDLGVTATAAELNYVDGVTSNVQTQLDKLQDDINSIPQSDWNQSDSTQLDYIKNRTHWSKTESTVVSEETVDTSDYTYYFTTPFALNVGQTYIVVFDGTTYNCVAFNDGNNYNRATIGGSYSNYSTYPFSIYVKSNGDTCITTEVNSTHTVKVTNVNETVQKLDEKYISDAFAKVDYVEDTVANVEETLTDKIDNKANASDISSGFVANVVATLDTSNWKGVAYGDGKYVAVGDRKFAYSTDGKSWQYGTLPFYANGIAYGNGMFCAYGYSETNVCYSTDGINWSTASTNYNSNKFSIYFLNGKFFISAGYAILSSSNCTSWSKFELGESCTLYGGAHGNGVYIMSGYGDTFISTNGTSWTKTTALSTTENYGSIFFVGGKFMAIAHGTTSYGASNKVAYSTNGTSWTYGTLPMSAKWVKGSYCNGTFMIAGYQSLAYSSDGVDWEIGHLPEGWNTIETMGSGNEFLLFEGSGSEVAIAKQNPYDLVFKADTNWTLIYDSGEITTAVNAFANINISGYKKFRVVVKCVNDGTNATSKNGAVTFTATNGTTYQFPCWTTMFTNAAYTSGNMATFEINDGWLICSDATRILKTSNFLGTEGGTADNLPSTGSGIMRCTSKLSKMMVSALDQDTNYYLLAGSRVIVWGCRA